MQLGKTIATIDVLVRRKSTGQLVAQVGAVLYTARMFPLWCSLRHPPAAATLTVLLPCDCHYAGRAREVFGRR